ncbi:MAG: hypothetical protein KAY24_04410 [Candidatus Eisenbacteria sp.]|nr:hypothetical protein [Candidatus Eisenbacteria bacterium]
MRKKEVLLPLLVSAVALSVPMMSGCRLSTAHQGPQLQQDVKGAQSRLAPIVILDQGKELRLTIEDVAKYHGDMCACSVAGFRGLQLAISELWDSEVPDREDFRIVSSWPGKGNQDAFEFVTRAKTRDDFTLDLRRQTDVMNVSIDDFTFRIIRKSTGASVRIRIRTAVLPEVPGGFFALRKKVKFEKTATPDEKSRFKRASQQFRENFLTLPVGEIFTFEKTGP